MISILKQITPVKKSKFRNIAILITILLSQRSSLSQNQWIKCFAFSSTVTLRPLNDDCTIINEYVILSLLPGDIKVYPSSDSVQNEKISNVQLYPIEFLNSLNPSGLLNHKPLLKMLL